MATKVSLGPEVKQIVEAQFGVKIDGVITLSDLIAVVSALIKVLKMPDVKVIVGTVLTGWVEKLKASKSKIDDLLIPGILIFRKTFGI